MRRKTRARLNTKVAELAVAAPQVIAMRTARMLAAGAMPQAHDRAEFSTMCTEKVAAYWESLSAIGRQLAVTQQEYARTMWMQFARLWMTPWWLTALPVKPANLLLPASRLLVPSHRQQQRAAAHLIEKAIAPVHKRATANARRLSRTRKKLRRR